MDQSNPDFLQDLENEIILEPVSPGLRFANYIIDLIIFYCLMFVFGAIWLASMYRQGAADPETALNNAVAMRYLTAFLVFLVYYTFMETATKGRSIGKLITGTVAVKDDGSPITFKEALIRSLCRMIPFEPFSAFGGRPWHDTIAHTVVIKKQR